MRKLLLGLFVLVASISVAQAVEVCGVELSNLSERRVIRPGNLDTHLGATKEITAGSGICQGVHLGPIQTSFDGYKEILVTLVVDDRGIKRMSTDFVAFQSGDKRHHPFFSVRGYCHWMTVSLLPDGTLSTTCRESDTFVATLSGSDGP